jgi:hypothetical protein
MLFYNNKIAEQPRRPHCQATGCFELAEIYVVVKETTEHDIKNNDLATADGDLNSVPDRIHTALSAKDEEFDGFKIILYLCSRHEFEFKYLLNGSELQIEKRRWLLNEHCGRGNKTSTR